MTVKFYKMLYKLAVTYLAVGIFTYSCAHVMRQKEKGINEETMRNCVIHFATEVDSCLNPFLSLLKRQRGQQRSKLTKIIQTFSQKTFCLHYEETLQCLHETITNCDTPETTSYVQERLSVPWVLHTNKICNINMKQETMQSNGRVRDVPKPKGNVSKESDGTYFSQSSRGNNSETDLTKKMAGVTSTQVLKKSENTRENTSDKSEDSGLKFRPSDTVIQRQTNINVYLNPTEILSENIFIEDISFKQMSITFEQKKDQVNTKRWKTKIGKLLFQQKKSL